MSLNILKTQFKDRHAVRWFVLLFVFAYSTAMQGQNITVSGTVSDANGPLPGASVVLQGTTNGTVTDFDGNYSLNDVPPNAVLEISFIGYRKEEVAVDGRTTVNVTLQEDLAQLDEVVVVGYGTQSRRVVTGAIESIDSDALASVPVTTSEQALQGRASGVSVINSGSPGQPPVVRIRGLGTMNNNDPLYVIDGVIGGRLADVDPQDIESIEVLKDASTTAIYGSKGSNGVVMITTKKGRTGKASLTLDSYAGIQFVTDRLDLMNTAEYIEFAGAFGDLPTRMTDPQYADMLNNNTDWQDAIFQSGFMQKHNLSISGGGENSDFRISTGLIDQEGILRNTGFKRHNFRANSNFTFGRLKIGETAQIVFNNQNPETEGGGRSVIRHAIRMAPYLPIYNPDNPGGYQGPNSPIDGQDAENPVRVLELGDRSNKSVNIIGGLYAEFEILDGLVFKTQAGLDYRTFNNNSFVPSYNDDNLGATHTQDHAAITKNSGTFKSLVYTNSLNYKTTLVEKHHLEALLLAEKQKTRSTNSNMSSRNYITNDVNEITNTNSNVSSSTFEYTRIGYLGRINYDFDEKYIFAASLRRDGSSRFGPNNRWGNFYSLAGGWRISEESFFNVTAINDLKLRGSWGTTGNDNIADYVYTYVITDDFIYPINGEGAVGASPSGVANPDVKWEETTMTNIGLDLGLLDNTITFSAEYYKNKSDDLLMSRPLPLSFGTHSGIITENVGSVETSGFEFTLGYNDYEGDFTWSANLNLGTSSNKALSLGTVGEVTGAGFIAGIEDNLTRVAPGQSLFHFYGFETDGIFQNQAEIDAHATQADAQPGDIRMVDQNGDGVINDDDRVKIGDPFPDLTFGLNVNAAYKNFDFNMFISGTTGNDVFNTLLVDTEGMLRLFNAGDQVLDRWTGEGTSNSIPRAQGATLNTRASDRFIEDGSYARLRNLTVGYTLPEEALGGYFSKFRIYLSGQNLVTLTGYSGYDPEVGAYTVVNPTSNFEVGIDRGNYPQPKSVILGLQVSF